MTFRTAATALLMIGAASMAAAQQPPSPRVYDGLFGPAGPRSDRQLDVTWSLMSAHDDNVLAEAGAVNDGRAALGGTWQSAQADAQYLYSGRTVTLRASGSGRGRYYRSLPTRSTFDGGGTVTAAVQTSRRSTVIVSGGARFEPYYQLTFLPDAMLVSHDTSAVQPGPASPVSDNGLTPTPSRMYTGAVGWVEKVGSRSSLNLDYGVRRNDLSGLGESFRSQLTSAAVTTPLTRFVNLRMGYGYGTMSGGTPRADDATTTHDISVGLTYSKALSQTRRMSLGFGTGWTVLDQFGSRELRLLLAADMTRDIARTWNVHVDYHRGSTIVEGLAAPAYADDMNVRLGGLLSPRLELAVSSGYSGGTVTVVSGDSGFNTLSASAEIRIAIARTWSLAGRYDYYRYTFDRPPVLPLALVPSFNRQSIRLGVTGWLPVRK